MAVINRMLSLRGGLRKNEIVKPVRGEVGKYYSDSLYICKSHFRLSKTLYR